MAASAKSALTEVVANMGSDVWTEELVSQFEGEQARNVEAVMGKLKAHVTQLGFEWNTADAAAMLAHHFSNGGHAVVYMDVIGLGDEIRDAARDYFIQHYLDLETNLDHLLSVREHNLYCCGENNMFHPTVDITAEQLDTELSNRIQELTTNSSLKM